MRQASDIGASNLSWEKPFDEGSGVKTYKVFRKTSTTDWRLLADLPATTMSYRDEDVFSSEIYYYQVKAANDFGVSDGNWVPGQEVPISPKAGPADSIKPTIEKTNLVDGGTVNDTKIKITGTAIDNNKVKSVEVSLDQVHWDNATGTTNWTVDVELKEGSNTVYIRVTDDAGNQNVTIWHVNVESTTSPHGPRTYTQDLLVLGAVMTVVIVSVFASVIISWRNEMRNVRQRKGSNDSTRKGNRTQKKGGGTG